MDLHLNAHVECTDGRVGHLENIILTSLAVNFIEKRSCFRSLSHTELLEFLEQTTHLDSAGDRVFMLDVKNDLIHFLRTFDDSLEAHLIEDSADLLITRFESELSGISALADLDVRFITCFVVNIQE